MDKKISGGLRYVILGSGSKANSYVFEYAGKSYMIDNGFSCKEAVKRLELAGFDPGSLQYLFVTHLHDDHFKGVSLLSRKFKIPVVLHSQIRVNPADYHSVLRFDYEVKQTFGDLELVSIPTSHDSMFSCGFYFKLADTKFTLLTDTGEFDQRMVIAAAASDVLFLEANYCPFMLEQGPYPLHLKKRIASTSGHLSNEDASDFMNLAASVSRTLKQIYLCHLSETNNAPSVLEQVLLGKYTGTIPYHICPRNEMILCGPQELS